jgi:hypothetical protein
VTVMQHPKVAGRLAMAEAVSSEFWETYKNTPASAATAEQWHGTARTVGTALRGLAEALRDAVGPPGTGQVWLAGADVIRALGALEDAANYREGRGETALPDTYRTLAEAIKTER